MSNKKTYPKGIYAALYDGSPSFVRANVKVDCQKAIEWFQAQKTNVVHMQILESQKPDDYGNRAYICVDDYKMSKEAIAAKTGIDNARKATQQEPQQSAPYYPPMTSPESEDIPF